MISTNIVMKKFIAWLMVVLLLVTVTACHKRENPNPHFLKSLFKGAQNKKTNFQVELEVAETMAFLIKYTNAFEQCVQSNKTIKSDSLEFEKPPHFTDSDCFITNKEYKYLDMPVMLELNASNQPQLTAILGKEANDKIAGKTLVYTRLKNKTWQCKTTVAQAFIPVGCEFQH